MIDWSTVPLVAIAAGGVQAAVPLYTAALGEVFAERSGVINLGLEGIMLIAAATAVATTLHSGSPWVGLLAAIAVGAILAGAHALATIWFGANQIASGIAMM